MDRQEQQGCQRSPPRGRATKRGRAVSTAGASVLPRDAPPRADEQAGQKQGKCGRQRPLESLRINLLPPRGEVVFRQRRERLLVDASRVPGPARRAARRVRRSPRRSPSSPSRRGATSRTGRPRPSRSRRPDRPGAESGRRWPCRRRRCKSSGRPSPPLWPRRARCLRGPRRR